MPNMADLIVKRLDGTTDRTFTALVAAAGDKSNAIWRANDAGISPQNRATITHTAKSSVNQKVRIQDLKASFPVVVNANGVETKQGGIFFSTNMVADQSFDESYINEAVAQYANVLKTALMQSILKSQYGPV